MRFLFPHISFSITGWFGMNIQQAEERLKKAGLEVVRQNYGLIGGLEIKPSKSRIRLLSFSNTYVVRKHQDIWISQYPIGGKTLVIEANSELGIAIESVIECFALIKAMPDDFEKICEATLSFQEIKLITRVDRTGAISVSVLDDEGVADLTAYEYQLQRANTSINDLSTQFIVRKKGERWEIQPLSNTNSSLKIDLPDLDSVVEWLDKFIER